MRCSEKNNFMQIQYVSVRMKIKQVNKEQGFAYQNFVLKLEKDMRGLTLLKFQFIFEHRHHLRITNMPLNT